MPNSSELLNVRPSALGSRTPLPRTLTEAVMAVVRPELSDSANPRCIRAGAALLGRPGHRRSLMRGPGLATAEMFGWSARGRSETRGGGLRPVHARRAVGRKGVGPIFTRGHAAGVDDLYGFATADARCELPRRSPPTAAPLLQPPFDVLDAGRMAVFAGPDGAVAGIWQAGKHTGAQFVTEARGWNWSQAATPATRRPRARLLSSAVFGWTLGEGTRPGASTSPSARAAARSEAPPRWAGELPGRRTAATGRSPSSSTTPTPSSRRHSRSAPRPTGPPPMRPMNGRAAALADPPGRWSFAIMSVPGHSRASSKLPLQRS